MKRIKLSDTSAELEKLTEDERRALRGSRFAPFATLPARACNDVKVGGRVPHPGGPVTTNKAAALAKFLQRKLGTSSETPNLDPALVEAAVENAKAALHGCSSSSTSLKVRHVESFSDSEKESENMELKKLKLVKKKKSKKKKKKAKMSGIADMPATSKKLKG